MPSFTRSGRFSRRAASSRSRQAVGGQDLRRAGREDLQRLGDVGRQRLRRRRIGRVVGHGVSLPNRSRDAVGRPP